MMQKIFFLLLMVSGLTMSRVSAQVEGMWYVLQTKTIVTVDTGDDGFAGIEAKTDRIVLQSLEAEDAYTWTGEFQLPGEQTYQAVTVRREGRRLYIYAAGNNTTPLQEWALKGELKKGE